MLVLLFILFSFLSNTNAFQLHGNVFSNRRLASPKLSLSSKTTDVSLADQQYPLGRIAFSLIPFTPETVGRRKTLLEEIVPNQIWTLDQLQGIINVNGKLLIIIFSLKFSYFIKLY
jgi:hypothetical protein